MPVTINPDTGKYHFTSQISAVTQNLFSIENITSEKADLTIYDTSGVNVIVTNTGNDGQYIQKVVMMSLQLVREMTPFTLVMVPIRLMRAERDKVYLRRP